MYGPYGPWGGDGGGYRPSEYLPGHYCGPDPWDYYGRYCTYDRNSGTPGYSDGQSNETTRDEDTGETTSAACRKTLVLFFSLVGAVVLAIWLMVKVAGL